ncbi:DUF1992 domain-containing protein [Nocardioides daejeonensis]|uniref:DnaJ family domain-containing protein n=1 Tax=Nocardioides daejeonensis TaxID=1046556 RepID=UPI000D74DD24|nr:DUF1992 domain-containing protein [Nocardioides daejeonensis]
MAEDPRSSRRAGDVPAQPRDPERGAAARRIADQTRWVDLQVRQAIERGDFDDLPGTGRPIADIDVDRPHDPDWWLKKLIAREQITGVLPPALALRKEALELDDALDRLGTEREVREHLTDFNRRVVEARRQLTGGPPVVTPTRDVDDEVRRWAGRRADRRSRPVPQSTRRSARRLWRRRSGHD